MEGSSVVVEPQADAEWRRKFKQYLISMMDQPIALGDLIDQWSPLVPLHHATRFCQQQQIKMTSLEAMRESTVRGELRRFRFKWNVERHQGRTIARSAKLTPEGRPCPMCGTRFFNVEQTKYCSASCGIPA